MQTTKTTKTAKNKAKALRKTANPRRTTLAHLKDAEALRPAAREHATELPQVTANPRRTVLMTAPVVTPLD
ncbi:hypothetical protein [Streptomyces albireticuli]|uniref:Uncharacterized protein n=1 Tax=Streptomyces albireticuli TaxID=1940 RepID=A0A2A2D417_9ACTN|nr:hypothetical protein [Streptomyces albireticuli]MCD9144129.1 hypothetical protein [Streptomyces albireticuli]MCD9162228.1 hypothetical protein [Streptomyces albireticuli]MCD9195603.1 hypothetical protein [Streptomyces albireticuli]PAU47228.1 hypothetical protein CK936_19800 [Streptomyces albireticuli]